jgi:hypothetical protein
MHPEDGLLLRFIDGELPARKVRQVGRHLEACWQCRTEVEELQGTVADCVRYRKTLDTLLPEPPNPWASLYPEFARVDIELTQEPWFERFKRALAGPAFWRWGVAVAAAVLVAVAVYQQFHSAPTVEAAVLLRKAVSAAATHPGGPHRILVQTRTQRMTRTIGSRLPAAKTTAMAAALEERLEAVHFSWEDPLSAKSYQTWYDGLASKRDEVTTVADPSVPAEQCYRIRTITPDGGLSAASLMLRATDLSPIESKLEFRDDDWVEFSEIGAVAAPAGGTTRAVSPSVVTTPRGEAEASLSDELQVVAALHEIGADLGDPVEVARTGGSVIVSGVGVSPPRQKQIRDAVAAIPHVQVQFSDPVTASAGDAVVPDSAASPSKPSAIQSRVEQQIGGRAEFERFSSQILDRNEAMMARAYAIRAMAERYPAETGMTAEDRQLVHDILRDNTAGLTREIGVIDRAVTPVLTAMGGSQANHSVAPQSTWQSSAEAVARAAHRVEILVSVMMGATQGNTGADRLPSDLLSALHDLRTELDQFQRIVQ